MRRLIRFILKHNFVILFIILELFSVSLLITKNPYQQVVFLDKFQDVSGFFYEKFNDITGYFNLGKANKILVIQNADLQNQILKLKTGMFNTTIKEKPDSLTEYIVKYARVINNSVNKRYNYLTLNAGKNMGIEKDMAVLGANGIIGIVIKVTDNYSSVISILNPKLSVGAKIKKNGYFGLLTWNGDNYRTSELNEIPDFVNLQAGDSIITSGYSAIFPEGELIGFVKSFKKIKGSGFLEIIVELSTDFKKLYDVYLIKNSGIKILELQNLKTDDQHINK